MPSMPLMDPDHPNEYQRTSYANVVFFGLLGLAVFAIAVAWLAGRPAAVELKLHAKAPAITAAGWVNGEAPTAESLAGKVVLVEVWATWCTPCRAMLPNMVKLHSQFENRGVVFIGLTSEGADKVMTIQSVLNQAGARWRTGWGADDTIRELGVEYLPSVYVIGSNGHIVWAHGDEGDLPRVLEKALEQSASRS